MNDLVYINLMCHALGFDPTNTRRNQRKYEYYRNDYVVKDDVEEYGCEIILEHANSSWFGFESIDSLYKYPYIYEINKPVEIDEREG